MRRFALILLLWPGVLAAEGLHDLTKERILRMLTGMNPTHGPGDFVD